MRPGQNKRMRGRNNNSNNSGNRKGPNPLTRSYESNGPDVKIRGNAHHVAEKYLQLARDAQSSGDPVAAESYLQHAEHYFRLIASAQQAQSGFNRQPDAVDTEGDDEDDSGIPDRFASPAPATPFVPPTQPQPYVGERQPYAGNADRPAYNGERQANQPVERQPYGERQAFNGDRQQQGTQGYGQRNDRYQDRNGMGRRPYRDPSDRGPDNRGGDDRNTERFDRNRNRQDRGYENRNGQDRAYDNRNGQDRPSQDRPFVPPPSEQPRDASTGEQPRFEAIERPPEAVMSPPQPMPVLRSDSGPRGVSPNPPDDAPGLPSFITTPTRAAPIEAASAPPDLGTASAFPGDDAGEVTKFPRRRRRPTRASSAEPEGAAADPSTPSE